MRYKRMLAMLLSFALIMGNTTSILADNNTADPGSAGMDVVHDETGDEDGAGNAEGAGMDDPSEENMDGSDTQAGSDGTEETIGEAGGSSPRQNAGSGNNNGAGDPEVRVRLIKKNGEERSFDFDSANEAFRSADSGNSEIEGFEDFWFEDGYYSTVYCYVLKDIKLEGEELKYYPRNIVSEGDETHNIDLYGKTMYVSSISGNLTFNSSAEKRGVIESDEDLSIHISGPDLDEPVMDRVDIKAWNYNNGNRYENYDIELEVDGSTKEKPAVFNSIIKGNLNSSGYNVISGLDIESDYYATKDLETINLPSTPVINGQLTVKNTVSMDYVGMEISGGSLIVEGDMILNANCFFHVADDGEADIEHLQVNQGYQRDDFEYNSEIPEEKRMTTVSNRGTLKIGSYSAESGGYITFDNIGNTEAGTLSANMLAKVCLEPGSTMHITEKLDAKILMIGQNPRKEAVSGEPAILSRGVDAEAATTQNIYTGSEDDKLIIKTLDDEGELVLTPDGTELFSDLIEDRLNTLVLQQPEGNDFVIVKQDRKYIVREPLPAPTIVDISQPWEGEAKIRFTYPSDKISNVKGFRLLTSLSENGTYEAYSYEATDPEMCRTDEDPSKYALHWYASNDTHITDDNVLWFKVAAVDNDDIQGALSGAVTNEGLTTGDADRPYSGVKLIDENGDAYSNSNPLILHVGETKKIGIMAVGANGNPDKQIWSNNDFKKLVGADVDFARWNKYHLMKVSGNEIVEFGDPVQRLKAVDVLDGVAIYLKGITPVESGQYCLELETNEYDLWGSISVKIPVIVEPAESGVIYRDPDTGNICETRQQAYQAVRDIITNRTNNSAKYGFTQTSKLAKNMNGGQPYNNYVYDRIVVRHELFNNYQIMMEDVCDFNSERAGMKPNEGDYIMHCIGDSQRSVTHWMSPMPNDKEVIFGADGEWYDVYEVYLPMITTKSEEAAVDAKVNSLMSTTFAGVKNGSNEQKIRAIYNYITSHVSGSVSGAGGSDRTYPKYHTAYHALIKGNGTCESFAMLFTRLSRELGVPSKVIMGVDANNHTYNIVENDDGYWYFIDTNTGRYLSAANQFSRTQEQSKFQTQEFINSYLSKLKNNTTYKFKSLGVTVIPSDGSSEFTGKYADVQEYIRDHILSDPESDTTYIVRLDGNITVNNGLSVDYGRYMDRVAFDLNGYTLSLPQSGSMYASEFRNGTVSVGGSYSSVNLGTMIGGSVFGTAYYSAEDADKLATIKLTDLKFTASKRDYPAAGYPMVELLNNSKVRFVIDGVTVNNLYFYVDTTCRDNTDYQASLVDLKGRLAFTNSRFTVAGNGSNEGPVIRLLRTVDNAGNKLSLGSLSFTNSEIDCRSGNVADDLTIVPVEQKGDTVSSCRLECGDVVASISGTFKAMDESRKMTAVNYPQNVLKIEDDGIADGCGLEYESGTLYVCKAGCVTITSVKNSPWGDITISANNLSSAIGSLTDELKKHAPGEYTEFLIEIDENAVMLKDTVIPAGITKAKFTSKDSTATLDFAGHTLSYSPTVGGSSIWLSGGLQLRSTGGKGSIKATAARNNILNIVANPDIVPAEAAEHYIDNVDFIAGGQGTAYVDLFTNHVQEPLDLGPVYHINSDINATLFKVNLGRYKVNNVTAKQIFSSGIGAGISANSLEMNNAVLSDIGLEISGTELKASKITLNSGYVTIDNTATADIGTFEMKGTGKFSNEGDVKIDTVSTIVRLDNKPGASFEAGTFNMASAGGLYLEPDSTFHVVRSAVINNLYLGQDAMGQSVSRKDVSGNSIPAVISRENGAAITVNTKVQQKDAANDRLAVKTVKLQNGSYETIETERRTKLLTTNIKSFPTGLIDLVQPEDKDPAAYKLMQVDNTILVASPDWIRIYAGDELIKSFSKWSEAMGYINTINNSAVSYKVLLSEDVTTCENLAFPAKAKSFLMASSEDAEEPVKIMYTGNISLTTDTVFDGIVLEPQVYDKKTGQYADNPASTINLNGKALGLYGAYSDQTFASVTGSGASKLTLSNNSSIDSRLGSAAPHYGKTLNGDKMTLKVTNAISVPALDMSGYALVSEKNSLTVANDAYLKSADIDVASNVAIKNLHTLDTENIISYGLAANNTFKINGTVDNGNETLSSNSVRVRGQDNMPDNSVKADINPYAVGIHVKYIEATEVHGSDGALISDPDNKEKNYVLTNYTQNRSGNWVKNVDFTTKDLVSSTKASASYFAIGKNVSGGNIGDVQFILKKAGNALRVEPSESFNVTLYRTVDMEFPHEDIYQVLGNFATLQEALTDIDRYADKTAEYRIEIDKANEDKATPSVNRVNLTMPKQAGQVTILTKGMPWNKENYARIYMKDTLNLNTDLVLGGVEIADYMVTKSNATTNTKLNIGLGGQSLGLWGAAVSDSRIGNITGNGTAKGSEMLVYIDSIAPTQNLTVNGNLNNVGKVTLNNTTVKVTGQVNIGKIEKYPYDFSHSDTTERLIAPVKSFTKDKSSGDITAIVPNITIAGRAENISFGLIGPDGKNITKKTLSGNSVLTNGGFAIAASPATDSEAVRFAWADDDTGFGFTDADDREGTILKKNGNIVYIGMAKEAIPYRLGYRQGPATNPPIDHTYCLSFADAVAEINKLGVKRDYTIEVNKDAADLQSPANLSMPQAKNIASLTIIGIDKDGMSNEDDDNIETVFADLYYTGSTVTLTCPVAFDNVHMRRAKLAADKKTYVSENTPAAEYLTATTLKASGYDVTYADKVVWDTPLNMDGGKKGSLIIRNGALVYTDIDMADARYEDGAITQGAFINGSITNAGTIDLASGQKLVIKGFKTAATTGKESYTVPSLTAAAVNISGGSMEVGDFDGTLIPKAGVSADHVYYPLSQPANVTVTDLTVIGNDGESLISHGKLTVTNLTLKNSSGVSTNIIADRDFSIANKGTLVSGTPSANLITRRNNKGVPYLTIPGTVELQDKNDQIGVTILHSVEELKSGTVSDCSIALPERVKDKDGNDVYTDMSRQLLTAASARADMFKALGSGDGVFLLRNDKAKTIVVYAAEEKKIKVIGSIQERLKTSPAPTSDEAPDDDETWYPTWADAVNAVNFRNDPNRYYSFVFAADIGVDPADISGNMPKPAAFTMPAKGKAKGVFITSDSDVKKSIYYTGAITLNCPAEFRQIDLNPLASVKTDKFGVTTVNGAKTNISAGDYELTLGTAGDVVTVGEKFKTLPTEAAGEGKLKRSGASQIGNVTAGAGTINVQSPSLIICGDIITGNTGKIYIKDTLNVQGKVNSSYVSIRSGKTLTAGTNGVTITNLVMGGGATLRDTDPTGKITIANINNQGSSTKVNTIEYGRNKNHATNLEIKGEVTKTPSAAALRLDMVSDNKAPAGDETAYILSAKNDKDMTRAKDPALIGNPKINLTDTKKLFIAPNLKTDSISCIVAGKETEKAVLVKGNNAFWYVTAEDDKTPNNTTKVSAVIQSKPEVRAVIDTDADETLSENDTSDGKTTISGNRVRLKLADKTKKQPETFEGEYLDWNQAIAEINALNDPEAEYEIDLVTDGIYDTNMTDANWRSSLNMPANNKAAALFVEHDGEEIPVRFSGAVTTYGHVEMECLLLNSQNNKGNAPADFNITMNPNSAKDQALSPGVFLYEVITMADLITWETRKYDQNSPYLIDVFTGTLTANQPGFIGKISGSRSKTECFTVDHNSLYVKNGIANVDEFEIVDGNVISASAFNAQKLRLGTEWLSTPSSLIALAASTAETVERDDSERILDKSFVGTYGDTNPKAAFTVTGQMASMPDPGADGYEPVYIKPIKSVGTREEAGKTYYNCVSFYEELEDQLKKKLVTAPKADAECFRVTKDTHFDTIAYKDIANIVYNVDDDDPDLGVAIERYEAGPDGYAEDYGDCISITFADSYKTAISMINSAAYPNSAYRITFMRPGEEATKVETASVNGIRYYSYSFGALTWPKASTTRSLVISGDTDGTGANLAELRYTGTLKPNAANLKVKFEDIILTEGTTKKTTTTSVNEAGKKVNITQTVFTPTYMITPDLSGANGVEIVFADDVKTLSGSIALSQDEKAILGGDTVPDGMLVFSKAASNSKYAANRLVFEKSSVLLRGASTMQGINVTGNEPTQIYTATPLTVNGDVTGLNGVTPLAITTAFADYVASAAGKPFTGWGNTQLTFNGDVSTIVEICPYVDVNPAKYNAKKAETAMKYSALSDNMIKGYMAGSVYNGLDVAKIGSYQTYAKLANVKKGGADWFNVLSAESTRYSKHKIAENGYIRVRKSNGALYLSSADPKVKVTRTTEAGITTESEVDDWAMAVAEINNAADKNSTYKIALLADLGGDTAETPPMKSLDMPKTAKHVTVVSENTVSSNHGMLITASGKVTFNCPTTLKGIGIIYLKKQKDGSYAEGDYDLAIGGNEVVIDDLKHTYNGKVSGINNITGTKAGSVSFILGTAPSFKIAGNTTGVGTVKFINDGSEGRVVHALGRLAPGSIVAESENGSILIHTNSDLNVTKLTTTNCRISSGKAMNIVNLVADGSVLYAGNATGHPRGVIDNTPATADVNVTNADLRNNTHVYAQNINVKTKLTTEESVLDAGYKLTTPGQGGKVTIAKLHTISDNWISAKQDKNGRSQITINGTINADPDEAGDEGLERIYLWYNNYSGLAQVYDGIVIATAPKAEASWFMPMVVDESDPGEEHYMGTFDPETEDTYKSGNTICFGSIDDCEVFLWSGTHDPVHPEDNEKDKYAAYSYFKTFEEAVKEIGTLNRRYQIPGDRTWYYEDYDIELQRDVEITNAKGTDIAPTLPIAVGQLNIRTAAGAGKPAKIRYSGALNIKSNTTIEDVSLIDTGANPGNLVLGNYELRLIDVFREVIDNPAPDEKWYDSVVFGAVSGGANGKLVIDTLDKYGHDKNDPYIVIVSSVAGIRGVELWDNSELDVSGNYGANRIVYMSRNRNTYTNKTNADDFAFVPTLKVGGNLNTQQIQELLPFQTGYLYMDARLYLASSKTNKINGIQNKNKAAITFVKIEGEDIQIREDIQTNWEKALSVYVDSAEVGTRVLTVKGLGTEYINGTSNEKTPFRIFKVFDNEGNGRNEYQNGENLMMGNAV